MAKQLGGRAASSHDMPRTGACSNSHEEEIDEYHSQEDKGEQCVHAYQKGEMVQVLSRTAQGWVVGQVVEPVMEGCHTVEFTIPDHGHTLFRKHLSPTSQQLSSITCGTNLLEYDPGTTFVCQDEARSALLDFVITFSPDLPVEEIRLASLDLDYKGNNAFKASLKSPKPDTTLSDFTIAYKPKHDLGHIPDIVLKVHALPKDEPDENERYKPVGPLGFVHTMLHEKGEKVHFHPDGFNPVCLGFTVHKDLSKDLQEDMRKSEKNMDKYKRLFERFKYTWEERGNVHQETLAEEADFIISYTSLDLEENNEFLKEITSENIGGNHLRIKGSVPQGGLFAKKRPLKICTDRSLGFGMHFYQGVDELTLDLGKHGFAEPVEPGTWWDRYKDAAMKTKHGMLVLNPSAKYFTKKACLREWTEIPEERKWIYNHRDKTVTQNPKGFMRRVAEVNKQGSSDAQRFHELGKQALNMYKSKQFAYKRNRNRDSGNPFSALLKFVEDGEPDAMEVFTDVVDQMKVYAENNNSGAIQDLASLFARELNALKALAEQGNEKAIRVFHTAEWARALNQTNKDLKGKRGYRLTMLQ